MKVLFGILVLAIASQCSQCESLERDRAVEDIRFRNPFNLRQFTGLHRIVGGIDGWFWFSCSELIKFLTNFPSWTRKADIANFPHHIGLIDLSRGRYICGGSVISPRWGLVSLCRLRSAYPDKFCLIAIWNLPVGCSLLRQLCSTTSHQSLGRFDEHFIGWNCFPRRRLHFASAVHREIVGERCCSHPRQRKSH